MELTPLELILIAHFRQANATEQRRIEQAVIDDDISALLRLLGGDLHETLKVPAPKRHDQFQLLRGQV